MSDQVKHQATPESQLTKYLVRLLYRWPYVLVFLLLSLVAGYAVNRYATPVYQVQAKITTRKFSEKSSSPVPGLIDANFFLRGIQEVYEEIPMLRSPARIDAALRKLDFRVSYFSKGLIKTVESMHGIGFEVYMDSLSESNCPLGIPIYVNHKSQQTFQLHIENERWQSQVQGKTYTFNQPVTLGSAVIRITNTNGQIAEPDKFYFVFNPHEALVNNYRSRLNMDWTMQGSSMIDISMQSVVPERDLMFLNTFYEVIQEIGLKEKNETLDNTIGFIDTQMNLVKDSLLFYQRKLDNLKLQKMDGQTDQLFTRFNEIDQKKAEIMLKDRYIDYLENYVVAKKDTGVFAPSTDEVSNGLLQKWMNDYISQRLTEAPAMNQENVNNPLVNREDSLRKKYVAGIFEAMRSARTSNRMGMQELDRQYNKLYGSVKNVQANFGEYSRYERSFKLNTELFDLLLKRKTEAAISKASATPDYKIIEMPGYSKNPFRPDKKQNLLMALAIGLAVPLGFFLVRDLTNPTIIDKDDLLMHTSLNLLAAIPHSVHKSTIAVADHPRSVVAEAFRAVRAKLRYFSPNSGQRARTIIITSSIAGEGKTFCSINLAHTLFISGKKTVLIAADLRKASFRDLFDFNNSPGLSEYLAGLAPIEKIFRLGHEERADIIVSGQIPPNPAELLTHDRMKTLIDHLKETYDYIIIDTPPIGIVADAMELLKYSNLNLLIVRPKVTRKEALAMVNELYDEGSITNFSLILNDMGVSGGVGQRFSGYLYGMGHGGYGYGYYEEDKRKKGDEMKG